MTDKTKSVDGWWILDSIDGRRWLGLPRVDLEETPQLDLTGNTPTALEKAIEVWPIGFTPLAIPQQVGDPRAMLARNPAPPQMQMTIQNVEWPASHMTPPLKFAFVPPWTIRAVGGCPLSAYPEGIQTVFLQQINGIEEACAKTLRDMARQQGNAPLRAVDSDH